MASNTNGFGGGRGRARRKTNGPGISLSVPGPPQVGMPLTSDPPSVAPVHPAAPVLVIQPAPRDLQPQPSRVPTQASPQAQFWVRAPSVSRPFGGVAALESGVDKMSVSGRGGDADGRAGEDIHPPRRPSMNAELHGDDSNEGYLVNCALLF